MNSHPGFAGAARSVAAREHLPMKNAAAIIAASSRNASPTAKRANPRLKKIRGHGKTGLSKIY